MQAPVEHGAAPNALRHHVFLVGFVVFVVPYVLAALYGALAIVSPSLEFGVVDLLISLAICGAASIPLTCGIRLSIAYLQGGAHSLRRVNRIWWWGACAGALIPIVGLIALPLRLLFGDFAVEPSSSAPADQPFGPTRIGDPAYGLLLAPLLIPFGHLVIERYFAARDGEAATRETRQ